MGFEPCAIIKPQYAFMVSGDLSVGDDQTLWIAIAKNCEVQEAYAVVKAAPTGAAIKIEIEKSVNDGAAWSTLISSNDLQIAAGSRVGEKTGLSESLDKNDLLRLNIDQIGSAIVGANLSVFVRAITPRP